VKEQQLIEYQEKMEELSQKHEVALNEGSTLRERVEHTEKLVILLFKIIICHYYVLYSVEVYSLLIK